MKLLEVSGALRLIYRSLGVKGLNIRAYTLCDTDDTAEFV